MRTILQLLEGKASLDREIKAIKTDFRKGFRCTREKSLGAEWE